MKTVIVEHSSGNNHSDSIEVRVAQGLEVEDQLRVSLGFDWCLSLQFQDDDFRVWIWRFWVWLEDVGDIWGLFSGGV